MCGTIDQKSKEDSEMTSSSQRFLLQCVGEMLLSLLLPFPLF